jgi:hypothetical protein
MRISLLLVSIFSAGCAPDYDLEKREPAEDGGPEIEVTPSSLTYGAASIGTETAKTFTINSVGATALSVTEVRIDGPEAFAVTSFAPGRLAPDESTDVVVTYTSTGGEDSAEAEVFSDDPDSPTIVTLNGGGLVPELTIDPDEVDFNYVGVGSSDDADIVLRNTGGATLTIDSIAETESVFTDAYAEALPATLEPGEEMNVTVTFTPDAGDAYTGHMEVVSDDPDGMKFATLNGSGAVDQPIAVCEANPDTVDALHEDTTWVGSGSYDPSGLAITNYRWTLVTQPGGSTATMPSGSGANRSGFTPDLAGTYEATLVVTNSAGEVSEPCTATLEAVPAEDLWIEIYWTHSGDDMDLHLLRPGGSRTTNGDCYYANCTYSGLDWGTAGDPSDDPALDIDDIPGTGPENINIGEPENGTFTVIVHDYPGSVYNGRNDVTMNIYIGGALAWSDTRDVDSEGTYYPFAEIDWPSGTVTPL